MKTLELNQMELVEGGTIENCAGYATGLAIGIGIAAVATGGMAGLLVGFVGSWAAANGYGACLFLTD